MPILSKNINYSIMIKVCRFIYRYACDEMGLSPIFKKCTVVKSVSPWYKINPINVKKQDEKAIKSCVFSSKTGEKRVKINVFSLFLGLKRVFFD